jgi:signal peptidase
MLDLRASRPVVLVEPSFKINTGIAALIPSTARVPLRFYINVSLSAAGPRQKRFMGWNRTPVVLKRDLAFDVAVLALVVVALIFGAPRLLNTDTPLAVVTSWSMEPTLHVGDLIVVSGREPLRIGDVIVYAKPNGELIVHRLVAVEEGLRGTLFITKGDANPGVDAPVDPGRVKGKVILVIPYLGTLRLFVERLIRLRPS